MIFTYSNGFVINSKGNTTTNQQQYRGWTNFSI